MRRYLCLVITVSTVLTQGAVARGQDAFKLVPPHKVTMRDTFWRPRIQTLVQDTLPHAFNPIILCNKTVTLRILFAAVNQTLQAFAKDPRWHLEGQLGFILVLHTWSQTLLDHFHLHGLIPGGALFEETH